MPRGGGGFRGGGFGGGGFRGGGFRGSSGGFRSGRVRSSGRPFGRTGARRTVSRAPRGRSYNRPHHRRYWGGYWRPWWRRPWYGWGGWWWGRPYRPWYYAPVYWGGGISLGIIALLIALPLLGMAFIPFPFTSVSADGTVTYRDTQTLFYNEYWFESESMKVGQTIEYWMDAIGSPSSEVTFLIWDHPFEDFSDDKILTGSYSESMTVQGDHDYQYLGYFFKLGSSVNFQYNVSGPIEFFIADANDLNRWNNWETIIPQISKGHTGIDSNSGSFTVPYAQDWYLVWYNSGSSPVTVDYSVDFTAVGAFDFSEADVVIEGVETVETNSFTVPNAGEWFFFIYFDPFVNPSESVDISFDVSYDTGITYEDHWTNFTPVLLIIGAFILILLLVAIVQRRSSRRSTTGTAAATTTTTSTPPTSTTTTATIQPDTRNECHRCKAIYRPGDVYCKNCGAKLVGRDYGVSKVITPASAKNCSSCGSKLKPGSRYCRDCGAKVEQDKKTYELFPDERKSFFCQLDNEKHPSTDSAYECVQCSRKICGDCYDNISRSGVTICPYCKGDLQQIQ
ncbi:MAG: double zinc ribbon domain-containing protein [Candidatus Hodarchaeales archaeon]